MLNPMPKTFDYRPPTDPWLDILHEDADIVVFNKPSGLLSVPGKDPALFDSLQSRALERFAGAGTIHRLDKDTSGIIVMAKHKGAHGHIGKQFEYRQTTKFYIARVWGHVADDEGLIDLPLATDWENKPRQEVNYERGRASQTRWQVVGREENATRLKLFPITGRTHQLRVHLKEIGHPILGDEFYATGEALAAADRLQLHAAELGFRHPSGGEPVVFRSEPPF
ncbi:pseudouridine synthase [Pelagibacterium flavum]|uniref:Dual-specificity RNA pseudouridine synthase RluA n=1 Tax=Pelagibacterium flavum TaxID=2984530 RepID=A0ABY6IY17_9HYPH|nr:pseudouridine synthase [Pelagibacterium sp. YIM 151497]UYQ74167.1 pseudouridine synthase [Pelagibacterium sp. YIM 151497]|eukprot:jgi/Tetstr1/452398/TSEL_039434.t1